MRALFALLLLVACAPVPPPAPGPTPVDRFAGQVYDCQTGVVLVERDSASLDVRACLNDAEPEACLLRQKQYNDATVACLVRDLGATATAAVNRGDLTRKPTADAARTFVRNHKLGYK